MTGTNVHSALIMTDNNHWRFDPHDGQLSTVHLCCNHRQQPLEIWPTWPGQMSTVHMYCNHRQQPLESWPTWLGQMSTVHLCCNPRWPPYLLLEMWPTWRAHWTATTLESGQSVQMTVRCVRVLTPTSATSPTSTGMFTLLVSGRNTNSVLPLQFGYFCVSFPPQSPRCFKKKNVFLFHTCLPLWLYRICSGKSSKSIGRSRNTDSLSKVPDSVIHETTTTNKHALPISPRVAKAFVPELTRATFRCVAHAWKIEICRFALGSALGMRERHKATKKSFSKVFWREHCIREAASQLDLQNQGAICKNVSCSRESMVESIDHAPSEKDTFKKAYHEKWPFVTVDEEGDTYVNSEVHSTVVIWLNWRIVECDWQTMFSAAQNR